MKRLGLVAALLLGSIIGTVNPMSTNFSDGHLCIQSNRKKAVKDYILKRISHVGWLKVFHKEGKKYLYGGSAFPVKCVKREDGKFYVFYVTAKHIITTDRKNLIFEITSNFDRKHGIGYQTHRIYRNVEVIAHALNDDVAVLRAVSDEKIPSFSLCKKQLSPLEEIYVAGYPGAVNLWVSEGLTVGPWNHGNDKHWKMTAFVWLGKSGGPVISKETGKVIGIVLGIAHDRGTLMLGATIMTPMSEVYEFVNKFIK